MDTLGLITATETLAAALAAETAALEAGDYAGATALAAGKLAATEGFQAARAAGKASASPRLVRAVELLRAAGSRIAWRWSVPWRCRAASSPWSRRPPGRRRMRMAAMAGRTGPAARRGALALSVRA